MPEAAFEVTCFGLSYAQNFGRNRILSPNNTPKQATRHESDSHLGHKRPSDPCCNLHIRADSAAVSARLFLVIRSKRRTRAGHFSRLRQRYKPEPNRPCRPGRIVPGSNHARAGPQRGRARLQSRFQTPRRLLLRGVRPDAHRAVQARQRRGDLLAQGVVQQRDALGILVIRLVHK